MRVNLDENGKFTSVTSNGQSYTPEKWNGIMQGQPLSTEEETPTVEFNEGSFGGAGTGGTFDEDLE